MNAIPLLLLSVFAVAVVLGIAAQSSRFCLHGGLRDAMFQGDARRLAAYVLAIGVAVLATGLAQMTLGQPLEPVRPPYTSGSLALGRYLIGGFVFGIGMMLARGCPLRNLVRVAQGSLQAVPVLVVMALSAYAMTRTPLFETAFAPWIGAWSVDLHKLGYAHQDLATLLGLTSPLARAALALVVAAVLIFLTVRHLPLRSARTLLVTSVVIGLVIAAGYWLTGGPLGAKAIDDASFMSMPPDGMGVQSFTFSAPLGDTTYFLMHPSMQTLSFGVVAVGGVLLGVLLSSLLRGEFKWEPNVDPRILVRQVIGGLLAGGSAVLGLGCTVGNGLSGLAVLSLGSLLSMIAMVVGAWGTLKVEALLVCQPTAPAGAKKAA